MSKSYVCNFQHITFSTQQRLRMISPKMQPRLWAYMAGIAKHMGAHPIAIGGIEDQVHMLLGLSSKLSVAKTTNIIKTNSSRWMGKQVTGFAWQRGFASFSVSASNVPTVKAYVLNQREHHKKRDYRVELVALLKKHGVVFVEEELFE